VAAHLEALREMGVPERAGVLEIGLPPEMKPDLQRVLFAADQIQRANEAMRDKDIDHQPLVLQIWQLDWAAELHMELSR